jgi:hypothetical protein
MTGDLESRIIQSNMKSLMNSGGLITGPAFDEGREQRCALYFAVLMRNRFYVSRRIYCLTIAGSG